MSAEFGRNSVIGSLWNFTEAVARPFEGRRMTYRMKNCTILCSMFAPLTRAPHLLLRTSTGPSSVRLNRFMEPVRSSSNGGFVGGRLKFCQIFVPLDLAKGKFLKTLASRAPPPHFVGGTVLRNIPFATALPEGNRGTAFRKRVQRYVELSGFSKLFGEKMQKT